MKPPQIIGATTGQLTNDERETMRIATSIVQQVLRGDIHDPEQMFLSLETVFVALGLLCSIQCTGLPREAHDEYVSKILEICATRVREILACSRVIPVPMGPPNG